MGDWMDFGHDRQMGLPASKISGSGLAQPQNRSAIYQRACYGRTARGRQWSRYELRRNSRAKLIA
jgi:hypothetical protein